DGRVGALDAVDRRAVARDRGQRLGATRHGPVAVAAGLLLPIGLRLGGHTSKGTPSAPPTGQGVDRSQAATTAVSRAGAAAAWPAATAVSRAGAVAARARRATSRA